MMKKLLVLLMVVSLPSFAQNWRSGGGITSWADIVTAQSCLVSGGVLIPTDGTCLTLGTGWPAALAAAYSFPTISGTLALGSTLYASDSSTLTALAGNTTTTRMFWRQTGNGTNSAAPAWDTLLLADVPNAEGVAALNTVTPGDHEKSGVTDLSAYYCGFGGGSGTLYTLAGNQIAHDYCNHNATTDPSTFVVSAGLDATAPIVSHGTYDDDTWQWWYAAAGASFPSTAVQTFKLDGRTGNVTTPGVVTATQINTAAASVASSATTNICAAAGNFVTVTGSTTITAFDSCAAGATKTLSFPGTNNIGPLLTHNATSLIMPQAASWQTTAGALLTCTSLGSGNWQCYNKVQGTLDFAAAPYPAIPGFRFEAPVGCGTSCIGTQSYNLGGYWRENSNGQGDASTIINTYLAPGLASLRTGTNASTLSVEWSYTHPVVFVGGSGNKFQYEFSTWGYPVEDSTSSDSATAILGMTASGSTAFTSDNSIYFRGNVYTAANYQCVTTHTYPGQQTVVDSGVPVVSTITGAHLFSILVPAAGTPITFYIDNVQVCSISTNLPDTSSVPLMGMVQLYKAVANNSGAQNHWAYGRTRLDVRNATE